MLQTIRKNFARTSFRTKMSLTASVITGIVTLIYFSVSVYLDTEEKKSQLIENIDRLAYIQAKNIGHEIANGRSDRLNDYTSALSLFEDIRRVIIYDKNREILALSGMVANLSDDRKILYPINFISNKV